MSSSASAMPADPFATQGETPVARALNSLPTPPIMSAEHLHDNVFPALPASPEHNLRRNLGNLLTVHDDFQTANHQMAALQDEAERNSLRFHELSLAQVNAVLTNEGVAQERTNRAWRIFNQTNDLIGQRASDTEYYARQVQASFYRVAAPWAGLASTGFAVSMLGGSSVVVASAAIGGSIFALFWSDGRNTVRALSNVALIGMSAFAVQLAGQQLDQDWFAYVYEWTFSAMEMALGAMDESMAWLSNGHGQVMHEVPVDEPAVDESTFQWMVQCAESAWERITSWW